MQLYVGDLGCLFGHQLDVTADILRSTGEVADDRGFQFKIADIDLGRFVLLFVCGEGRRQAGGKNNEYKQIAD